jgi:hypothetical protein
VGQLHVVEATADLDPQPGLRGPVLARQLAARP